MHYCGLQIGFRNIFFTTNEFLVWLVPTTHFLSTESTEFFFRVAALPEGIALPKFLRAKVGFTFSVGGDMERRRLAGMKPVFLFHHRKKKVLRE